MLPEYLVNLLRPGDKLYDDFIGVPDPIAAVDEDLVFVSGGQFRTAEISDVGACCRAEPSPLATDPARLCFSPIHPLAADSREEADKDTAGRDHACSVR